MEQEIKFYYTHGNCMGWVPWLMRYLPFDTYREYVEFVKDEVKPNARKCELRPEISIQG